MPKKPTRDLEVYNVHAAAVKLLVLLAAFARRFPADRDRHASRHTLQVTANVVGFTARNIKLNEGRAQKHAEKKMKKKKKKKKKKKTKKKCETSRAIAPEAHARTHARTHALHKSICARRLQR